MEPVICFFQDNSYLVSTCYQKSVFTGKEGFNAFREMGLGAKAEFKIVALDFEIGNDLHDIKGTPGKIILFVLKTFDVMDQKELKHFLEPYKTNSLNLKPFEPSLGKGEFAARIQKIKAAITSGNIYQMNFTFPFLGMSDEPPLTLFSFLHDQFHGDCHASIPLENGYFHSFSPEVFLKKQGQKLSSFPIKGTAKPGQEGRTMLLESQKEEAELSMIVDLIRNDLNRVTTNDSVRVRSHRSIMDLGDLQHTYSEIVTQTSMTLPDILERTYPGGSVSGCPKHSALDYIKKFESGPRGFYTGSLGWWHKDDFALNIAIRSLYQFDDGRLVYHAGGGIVFESIAEAEYEEALLKAEKLVKP